jgi:EAL domain-containing protein (putative c-di-GMP-specific phosphodiesterase class I)
VSLDGFGSAGVGFDHVKSLPLDFLKIDGRIIFAIARDPVAAAKVAAIRRVCRGIGVRTIAEMVESEEVRQKLAALEVDYAQGFGIALPRPLGALVRDDKA